MLLHCCSPWFRTGSDVQMPNPTRVQVGRGRDRHPALRAGRTCCFSVLGDAAYALSSFATARYSNFRPDLAYVHTPMGGLRLTWKALLPALELAWERAGLYP